MHSHIRLKPVLAYLFQLLTGKEKINVLDVGCGSGVIAFELLKQGKKIKYLGIDNSQENIISAKKILKHYNNDDLKFNCGDAVNENFQKANEKLDMVLLIDVLEHIINPQKMLQKIVENMKDGGLFIVSVPTPLYPIVFGRAFHIKVGHKIDGYTLEGITQIFEEINCELVYSKYNTGFISNIGCFMYYRIFPEKRVIEFFKIFFLYVFKFLDFFNGEKISSSLFVVFKVIR